MEQEENQKGNKKPGKKETMTRNEVNALISQKKEWEKDRNRAENERNCQRNEWNRSQRGVGPCQGQDDRRACFWCKGPHRVSACPVIKEVREIAQRGAFGSQHQQGNA